MCKSRNCVSNHFWIREKARDCCVKYASTLLIKDKEEIVLKLSANDTVISHVQCALWRDRQVDKWTCKKWRVRTSICVLFYYAFRNSVSRKQNMCRNASFRFGKGPYVSSQKETAIWSYGWISDAASYLIALKQEIQVRRGWKFIGGINPSFGYQCQCAWTMDCCISRPLYRFSISSLTYCT